jgi:hypothetical protein
MKKFLKMLGLALAKDLAEAEDEVAMVVESEAEAWETLRRHKAEAVAEAKTEAAPAADIWAEEEAAPAAEAEVEAEVANAALAEAKANLEKMSQAEAKAEAEASILDEVHEVNRLTRQLIVQMGEKKLLPEQLQQRRKDAEQDNASVQEALEDLGI